MNWLAWRQHRKQFMIVGIFLALFAAFMVPTGLNFWHTYQHALSTCHSSATVADPRGTCDRLSGELYQSQIDNLLLHLVPVAIVFVPILLGIFWGVPFLAREYAEGTNKLVWTQGVSRKKWLSVKLTWVLGGAVIFAAGFAALDAWWSKPNNALNLGRFGPIMFGSQGIVLIGYAVFAILIALIMIVVPNFVRPYYISPISYHLSLLNNIGINAPPTANSPVGDSATLIISQTVVSKDNQPLDWSNPPQQCIVTNPPGAAENAVTVGGHTERAIPTKAGGNIAIDSRNGGPPVSLTCLAPLGYYQNVKYQPAYRYWDFQRIETGLFLALSVLPIAGAYWLVLKRDA
jgi:hypothetical protein